MFRLLRPAMLFPVLATLSVAVPTGDAAASQWKVTRSNGHAVVRMSGHQVHSHPAASSGAMLGHYRNNRSAAATVRYSTKRGKFSQDRHHRRNGSLIIIVGPGAAADQYPDYRYGATSGTIPVLEGGSCDNGEYCSIRLGNASNAPKIITLNSSGRTITNDDVAAQ